MSTWIDFKELRKKLQFSEILRHYQIVAKVKGDRGYALCPLPSHPPRNDEKKRTASLSINFSRNIFQCFGCKTSGNAVEFASRMEGFDPSDPKQFRQAAIKIAEIFHISFVRSRNSEDGAEAASLSLVVTQSAPSPPPFDGPLIVNAPLNFELKHLDPRHPYLASRGFTPETIEHFGLGYCNRGLMKDRVAIPLHDPIGQLVGYAGRAVEDPMITDAFPKYRLPGDRVRDGVKYEFRKSHLLYNHHRIRSRGLDLIVVEGFASTWWMHQCGFTNVAALMGSSCSEEQADLIAAIAAKVWIMSDGDPAGELYQNLWEQLGTRVHCRRIKLDDGKQPTNLPKAELNGLFNARQLAQSLVFRMIFSRPPASPLVCFSICDMS